MIISIWVLIGLISVNCHDSLHFVFEHFRHGARSPWRSLSKNYTDVLGQRWLGLGELTEIGVTQLYLLGTHAKERYKGFISPSFDPKEVLVYSTNVNRTMMSAQAHMSGMYSKLTYNLSSSLLSKASPPINMTIPTELNLSSIPVPIHTYEEKKHWGNDVELFQTFTFDKSANCPKVIPIRKANVNAPIVKDFLSNFTLNYSLFFKEEYQINELNYSTINDICDAFISGYFESKDLAKFTNREIDIMTFLNNCYHLEYIKQFHIDQGGKASFTGVMSMSSTMLKMVELMENRMSINNKALTSYSSPKFVIYSGHDSTITSMESFLKAAFNCDYLYTPFSTSQFFELHKRQAAFWVEYYYNGALQFNLTFTEFKQKVTQTAWKEERVNDFCYIYSFQDKITIGLALIVITLLVISISLTCYCRKKSSNQRGFIKVIETKDDESPVNTAPAA